MKNISKEDPIWWSMYALTAPIIVWPGTEPEFDKLKIKAQIARFNKIGDRDRSEAATDAEVALYLSSASMIEPLNSDWAKVYGYAARKAFPVIPKDIDIPEKLDSEQQKLYDGLARWIFKQQAEALNGKLNHKTNYKGLKA